MNFKRIRKAIAAFFTTLIGVPGFMAVFTGDTPFNYETVLTAVVTAVVAGFATYFAKNEVV